MKPGSNVIPVRSSNDDADGGGSDEFAMAAMRPWSIKRLAVSMVLSVRITLALRSRIDAGAFVVIGLRVNCSTQGYAECRHASKNRDVRDASRGASGCSDWI